MSRESEAPLELKVVSPKTVELGTPPVVGRMATCKRNALLDCTSILTPARTPVTPAVNVCATNLQHSLILAPKSVGEVKVWSMMGVGAGVDVGILVNVGVAVSVAVLVGVGPTGDVGVCVGGCPSGE